jgi:hypothetical protein
VYLRICNRRRKERKKVKLNARARADYERERARARLCVCVCVRERERERGEKKIDSAIRYNHVVGEVFAASKIIIGIKETFTSLLYKR